MNNQEKFLLKSIIKHEDRYDYSLVEYESSRKKIKIICKEHGIFEQEPANHLRGQGCPMCAGVKKYTKDSFIMESNIVHNNFYDYSLVEYKNNKTKVKIICPEHGIFEVRPDNHKNKKSGCSKCANNHLYSNDEYISKCNIVHNNFYNYSLVEYKNAHDKIKIICPIHGVFEQVAYAHIKGIGCSKCSQNYNYTNNEYIKKCNIVHNNFYDYSLTEYTNSYKKIKIICPIHGVFEQVANSHLDGVGCKKCYNEKMTYDTKKFIVLSNKKHNNKYDYSLVEYKNSNGKVKINCPEHGVFEQISSNHLRGQGCPMCNDSKGEKEIQLILDSKNIKYIKQHKFNDCKNIKTLPFDFYLPDYNMCIEFDGLQHFKPIEYFGGVATFDKIKINDKIKNDYCLEKNIKLLRIKYNEKIENKLSL